MKRNEDAESKNLQRDEALCEHVRSERASAAYMENVPVERFFRRMRTAVANTRMLSKTEREINNRQKKHSVCRTYLIPVKSTICRRQDTTREGVGDYTHAPYSNVSIHIPTKNIWSSGGSFISTVGIVSLATQPTVPSTYKYSKTRPQESMVGQASVKNR